MAKVKVGTIVIKSNVIPQLELLKIAQHRAEHLISYTKTPDEPFFVNEDAAGNKWYANRDMFYGLR